VSFVQESKRSAQDLCGRSDGNVKVIFPREDVRVGALDPGVAAIKAGDYVLVKVCPVSLSLSLSLALALVGGNKTVKTCDIFFLTYPVSPMR